MPDGRFLAKTVAHDLELNRVTTNAAVLFLMCIPHLDVEGRMMGHPEQVKSIAVPLRKELTETEVARCLGELADAKLVRWYDVGGRSYLQFPGFQKNQRGLRPDRESASTIPPPRAKKGRGRLLEAQNGAKVDTGGTLEAQSTPTDTTREALSHNGSYSGVTPESSGPAPAEIGLSEVEVKGREVKQEAARALARAPTRAARASPTERLIQYVGEQHRETVLEVARLPGTTPTWARGVLASYGPGELADLPVNTIPEERRPRVLARALQRTLTDANRWRATWFRSVYLARAAEPDELPTDPGEDDDPNAYGPGLSVAAIQADLV